MLTQDFLYKHKCTGNKMVTWKEGNVTEITQSQENPLLCLNYLKVFTMKYSKMLQGDPGLVTTMLKLLICMCVCAPVPADPYRE